MGSPASTFAVARGPAELSGNLGLSHLIGRLRDSQPIRRLSKSGTTFSYPPQGGKRIEESAGRRVAPRTAIPAARLPQFSNGHCPRRQWDGTRSLSRVNACLTGCPALSSAAKAATSSTAAARAASWDLRRRKCCFVRLATSAATSPGVRDERGGLTFAPSQDRSVGDGWALERAGSQRPTSTTRLPRCSSAARHNSLGRLDSAAVPTGDHGARAPRCRCRRSRRATSSQAHRCHGAARGFLTHDDAPTIPLDMDHSVKARSRLRMQGLPSNPAAKSWGLQPSRDTSGGVCVNSSATTFMPGVESSQKVDYLGTSNLTNHQSVGTHSQRRRTRSRMLTCPEPSTLGGRTFQPHDVFVVRVQLAGILHDQDSLARWRNRQQGAEQCCFPASRSAADQEGGARFHQCCC